MSDFIDINSCTGLIKAPIKARTGSYEQTVVQIIRHFALYRELSNNLKAVINRQKGPLRKESAHGVELSAIVEELPVIVKATESHMLKDRL